jgi:hypothetical protein
VFLLLCSICVLGLGIGVRDGADAGVVTWATAGAIGAFALCLFVCRSAWQGNWFHPLVLFFVSYLIVYFQAPWGVTHDLPVPAFVYPYPDMINRSVVVAVVGLASLLAGYLFIVMTRPTNKQRGRMIVSYRAAGLSRVVNVLLILAWVLNAAFIAVAGRVLYQTFVYAGAANWGSGATYIFAVLTLVTGLLTAAEAVYLRQKRLRGLRDYVRQYDRRVLLYLLFYLAPHILSGDRGTVIFIAFAMIGPFYLHGFRMRFRSFAVAVVVAAFALAFMGKMRTRDASLTWAQRVTQGRTGLSAVSQGWLLPTLELGNSYRTFNAAIAVVPQVYPHANGRFLWGNLSSVIPFYSRAFSSDQTTYGGSAALFFTNLLRNGDFSAGEGSSVLGSIYLDFGFVGVPIIMFILGCLLAIVTHNVRSSTSRHAILWTYFGIIALYQAIKIPRSDPFFWVQEAAWGAAIYFLIVHTLLVRMKVLVVSRPGQYSDNVSTAPGQV